MVCASQRHELKFQEAPEGEGAKMQFRLVYHGPLPAEGSGPTRKKEKHSIRRVLHGQLAQLWREIANDTGFMAFARSPGIIPTRNPEEIAEDHKIANRKNDIYRFVPLISERFALACSLDILFMRRDNAGALIQHGGDVDNRIKVLFDALRMPQNSSELPDEPPSANENPFFCLMQDDKLITKVCITTERLLQPLNEGERIHDVFLVITVEPIVLNPAYAPWRMWVP